MLRFRRFQSRLLVLIAGLVALVQGSSYFLVTRINRRNAEESISANLEAGAMRFEKLVQERTEDNTVRAELMTGDYALRQLLLNASDSGTLRSALGSYLSRFGASRLVLLSPEHKPLASTIDLPAAEWGQFAQLAELADESTATLPRSSGYALFGTEFHVLLVVPVYAPRPEIAAWLGVSLRIDDAFAQKLKDSSRLEITFRDPAPRHGIYTSTLSEPDQSDAVEGQSGVYSSKIGSEHYLGLTRKVPLVGGGFILLQLQRSLDAELAPVRWMQQLLLYGGAVSLIAAMLLAAALSRKVSQPLQRLASHTRVVAGGDYVTRLELGRVDEFGDLAKALNDMSEGLSERDRVRDLLDKNVSPEIAAKLLREGSGLSGEERVVTILFCDLRGFTSLSETMQPKEVLALLNRYLDRMSGVIDSHGGVIDKYIGDAIMALFGAPLPRQDAALQAVQAACQMRNELESLNRELATESLPTLGMGIGLNTARVVAGNMGSSRRMNYSVIGDGVNVAARLQSMTRRPEYACDIIASEACVLAAGMASGLRDLGLVPLKGRMESIRAYAVS